MEKVVIDKLVHGGQGLATLATGQKVFVWNALPGEKVNIRVIKKKRHYVEAIAEEIVEASPDRIEPQEANYLATSPWQIMKPEVENTQKAAIVRELFAHEKVTVPAFGDAISSGPGWHYRNKMEYSFWGDDDGLHLALHQRGSSGKHIVNGSKLALPAVDTAANAILAMLRELEVRAGDLKTVMIRANQAGEAVASLFVKPTGFAKLALPAGVKGLRVYHSNPKSPASVPTELIQEHGDVTLVDMLNDTSFTYDVDSFFQVNIPVFETTLTQIKSSLDAPILTDMYAGVGSIGLSVAKERVQLIELHPATAAMAEHNARHAHISAEVVEASSEKALEYITDDIPVVVDPPRAGLHPSVVKRMLETKPPTIVYLSCNPATQARDLAKLQEVYDITEFTVYNYFPRTPHIETLAVLRRK